VCMIMTCFALQHGGSAPRDAEMCNHLASCFINEISQRFDESQCTLEIKLLFILLMCHFKYIRPFLAACPRNPA